MIGGSGFAYQRIGLGATSDALYAPAGLFGGAAAAGSGGLRLTTAYGIRGAFNHNWDPFWSTSLFGSYSAVRYQGNGNDGFALGGFGILSAAGLYCAGFAVSTRARLLPLPA